MGPAWSLGRRMSGFLCKRRECHLHPPTRLWLVPPGRMTGSALPLAHILGDASVRYRKPSEHLQEPRLTRLCASPLMMCACSNGHNASECRGAAGPSNRPADLAAVDRELLAMPGCGLRRLFAPPLQFALSSRSARTNGSASPGAHVLLCMYLSADVIFFDAKTDGYTLYSRSVRYTKHAGL